MNDTDTAGGARHAYDAAPWSDVMRGLAVSTIVTYLLLIALTRVPVIDSTSAPYVDLTSVWAEGAYWIALSGSAAGAPIVVLIALCIFASRPGIVARRRIAEAVMLAVVAAICAGGGAAINEHGVKETLEIPRPNIVFLAGVAGSGPLRRTPAQFYALGGKDVRSDSLRVVLEAERPPVALRPSVRAHWVHETGYSFPSGHAFSAMFIAVFFLAAALSYLAPPRALILHLLMPWALLVGLSRPVLRVHTPADVVVGGAEGIALGLVGFLALRVGLERWGGSRPFQES